MATAMFFGGIVIAILSAVVLATMTRIIIRANQAVRARGIEGIVPLGPGWLVVVAWAVGLLVGLGLIILSYR
jgi:hypothetical protein